MRENHANQIAERAARTPLEDTKSASVRRHESACIRHEERAISDTDGVTRSCTTHHDTECNEPQERRRDANAGGDETLWRSGMLRQPLEFPQEHQKAHNEGKHLRESVGGCPFHRSRGGGVCLTPTVTPQWSGAASPSLNTERPALSFPLSASDPNTMIAQSCETHARTTNTISVHLRLPGPSSHHRPDQDGGTTRPPTTKSTVTSSGAGRAARRGRAYVTQRRAQIHGGRSFRVCVS